MAAFCEEVLAEVSEHGLFNQARFEPCLLYTSPDVLYGETELVDKEGHFIRMRRLAAPEMCIRDSCIANHLFHHRNDDS